MNRLRNLILFGRPAVCSDSIGIGGLVIIAYAAGRILIGLALVAAGVIVWRMRR